MVKKCFLISSLLFSLQLQAQQFKAGIIWPFVQFNAVEWKQPVLLDSTLQDKRLLKADQLRPLRVAQTDFPGLYLQWETKQNLFVRTEFRIASAKYYLGPAKTPDSPDTNFIHANWTITRPMITAECGYLLGHKKAWNFFVAGGLSLSVFRFFERTVPTFGYDDYDAVNYYNYFASDPWFLSLQLRWGIQRRAFTVSSAFKTSLTAVHPDRAINQLVCWSFIELGWHFYRSGFISKKQFREAANTGSLDRTVEVGLKKSGASTGLRAPLLKVAMDRPYLDAWQSNGSNYIVNITEAPQQKFSLEVFGNNVNGLNSKKTWYLKNEYGGNILTLQYKNVLRKTGSTQGTPDTDDRKDIVSELQDKQHVYLSLFYGVKTGYRFKTGKRSFIYGDVGLRYQLSLKRHGVATEVPYIKKSLAWVHPEIGFQFGHKGVHVGAIGVLGRPDAFRIYKNMNILYLGIYHEIYSK